MISPAPKLGKRSLYGESPGTQELSRPGLEVPEQARSFDSPQWWLGGRNFPVCQSLAERALDLIWSREPRG